MAERICLVLNGQPLETDIAPARRVIDWLREDLGLTGSKEGCGTGECGACTLLVDGEPRLGCLLRVGQLAGRRLETVEGLDQTPAGRHLLAAFAAAGAVQCGYCIPGMELAALALVRQARALTREQIRQGLSGNLCRCTGYVKILDAVELALRAEAEHADPAPGR